MSDQWTYDPGYRREDPRCGLSPRQLLEHYDSRPTQWLVRSTYGPLGVARRNGALSAHREYLYPRRDRIYFLGPVLEDDGATPIGSWLMLDAPSRADALAFIAGEGFVQAGMISHIDIKRFVETSLTPRRQLELRPEPGAQLFLCELTQASDGEEKRRRASADHHLYQAGHDHQVIARGPIRTDDNRRNIGDLYIVQVGDRKAAEAFIAADPFCVAGVYSDIRIDRWRFGGAISHPPDAHAPEARAPAEESHA